MSSTPVSDAQLIARAVVQDDRHAFGELVRRHQSAVRSTLRRLTGGSGAASSVISGLRRGVPGETDVDVFERGRTQRVLLGHTAADEGHECDVEMQPKTKN